MLGSALMRLRSAETLAQLQQKAVQALCDECGLERAIISRIQGTRLVAEVVHFKDDSQSADRVRKAWQSAPPELEHTLLESELTRRRVPMLVADAQSDERVYRPLVELIGTRSYVAAPILPSGRVIGFIHADQGEGDVTEDDLRIVSAFAEAFGFAAERTILLERLRFQRRQLRRQMMSTEALAMELASEEIDLAEPGSSPELAWAGEASAQEPSKRLENLLTRRELDVLTLMSSGATNAQIADRLVLAEGTVKTHVKHILRKLRASNRAEAVSRYMKLTAGEAR